MNHADPTPEFERVVNDLRVERRKQVVDKGYTPEHDDQHRTVDLLNFGGVSSWVTGPTPFDTRAALVRLGACVIAAIEHVDRRTKR